MCQEEFLTYFSRSSNKLELASMVSSAATLVVCMTEYVETFKVISFFMMFLFIIDLFATLRYRSIVLYFIMFKKVAFTFLKFFIAFVSILFVFTLSFLVFFKNPLLKISEQLNIDESASKLEEDKKPLQNFKSFWYGFMKVILMLSGEYTIEPFTLTSFELLYFFVFVITTFILFNLIIGLTVDDVQTLSNDARKITLKQNANSIIEASKLCSKIYLKNFEFETTQNVSCCVTICKIFWNFLELLMKRMLSDYYLLHKVDKFYVNISTKKITFDVGRAHESPFKTESSFTIWTDYISHFFFARDFCMEMNAFKYCKDFSLNRKSETHEGNQGFGPHEC